jgi:hypothetical protein
LTPGYLVGLRKGSDFLVADQRDRGAGAAFGHEIGNRVEDGIIFTVVVRAVVALDIDRLRRSWDDSTL